MLDVGCGPRKREGSIGIDKDPSSAADVFHDLNNVPYPFPDNSFEIIYCDNVLEHLTDVPTVMTELHRIAQRDALISVTVPFFAHRNAYNDPTHKHFFGIHSFDYFVAGTTHAQFHYSEAEFVLVSVEFEKGLMKRHWFDRMMTRFANAKKDLYENRLAHMFPLQQLTFTLKVVKA